MKTSFNLSIFFFSPLTSRWISEFSLFLSFNSHRDFYILLHRFIYSFLANSSSRIDCWFLLVIIAASVQQPQPDQISLPPIRFFLSSGFDIFNESPRNISTSVLCINPSRRIRFFPSENFQRNKTEWTWPHCITSFSSFYSFSVSLRLES